MEAIMSTVEPERSFVLGSRAKGSAWESGELLLGTDGSPDFVNEGFINEGFVDEVIEGGWLADCAPSAAAALVEVDEFTPASSH